MSEFFLELFSEEIPSRLQINARNELTQIFKKFFDDNEIIVKGKINTYSTPNRLIVHINKISKDVIKKAEEIRGPNINAPEKALEGSESWYFGRPWKSEMRAWRTDGLKLKQIKAINRSKSSLRRI